MGINYRGCLYAGLMLTEDGPKVLEFNVRFGDPETEVVFPRWSGDVTATLAAAASGALSDHHAPAFSTRAAVCVVLATPGYPENPEIGARIEGLDDARAVPGAQIYASGVGLEPGGTALVTSGGRVLNVVGLGDDLKARANLLTVPPTWFLGQAWYAVPTLPNLLGGSHEGSRLDGFCQRQDQDGTRRRDARAARDRSRRGSHVSAPGSRGRGGFRLARPATWATGR